MVGSEPEFVFFLVAFCACHGIDVLVVGLLFGVGCGVVIGWDGLCFCGCVYLGVDVEIKCATEIEGQEGEG